MFNYRPTELMRFAVETRNLPFVPGLNEKKEDTNDLGRMHFFKQQRILINGKSVELTRRELEKFGIHVTGQTKRGIDKI
jgi:hypothetical protein